MKNFFRKNGIYLVFGIVILSIYFVRFYHLTILPVFADEAIYIRWAQVMANEPTLRFLPLSDGKQPLFMWVLMFLVKRFSDPLFVGRLVSVFSGVGTMIGLGALSYYVFKSKKVAFITSFIYAISPFAFFFDRMALVDSMLAFLGVWTLFLGLVTAKTLRLDASMLTGFALGFAGLTKSPAIFFAALLLLGIIFQKGGKARIKYLGLTFVSWIIAFGMYNIQRLGPNFNLLSSRTADYVFPLSKILGNPLDPFIYNFPTAISWIWIMGPSIILLFVVLGIYLNFKKYKKETIVFVLWFLAPLVYECIFAKSFTARYVLFTLPPFYILAGSVFLASKSWINKALVLGMGIFIGHSFYFNYRLLTDPTKAPLPLRERMGYLEEWTSGIGIKQVADFFVQQAKNLPADKQIIVGTEGYFGTLPDGLQIYLTDYPNIVVIGVGVNLTKVPESLVDSRASGNKTYLVINNSRLLMDPEENNLATIASYKKEMRHPGTMEYVNGGPQEILYLFEVK